MQLLSIDPDPIFRLGLRVACEQYPDLEVVADVDTETEALGVLEARSIASLWAKKPVDLVILAVERLSLRSGLIQTLAVCGELKNLYPNLPLLLLGGPLAPDQLGQLQAAGAKGYCPKDRDISETIEAIRVVASGGTYWPTDTPANSQIELNSATVQTLENSAVNPEENAESLTVETPVHTKILAYFCVSGLREIDAALAIVKADLEQIKVADSTDLATILDGIVVSGRRRELLAARWIVSQLLEVGGEKEEVRRKSEEVRRKSEEAEGKRKTGEGRSESLWDNSQLQVTNSRGSGQSLVLANNWQGSLFDSVAAKLQVDLVNLTGVPLEIDILRSTKQRELMSSILRKLRELLEELRFSQVQQTQLSEKMPAILRDLWEATIIDFFGRYYTLQTGENLVVDSSQKNLKLLPESQREIAANLWGSSGVEVVSVLLADETAVATEILDKIPMTVDLFAHLLFEIPLTVDNLSCVAGSPQAMQRSEALLENLVIQVASGVVQPLLNNFADIEEIKQTFYDGKLISTREIERFRNDLSWRYRWDSYFVEPKAIFESRFWLFVWADSGIKKISIYAPRNLELAQLSGWQLALTLVLETRDAIAPRVRAVISLLGTAVVYVLTQVIGRGIGLIGRGIIQGIGNSLQDTKFGKNG